MARTASGGLQRVGARGELDGEARGRQPVVLGVDGVALGAQTRCAPRRVSSTREPSVLTLSSMRPNCIGVLQPLRADDGGVEALALDRGQPAELTDRHLHVLRLQRVGDVSRREPDSY